MSSNFNGTISRYGNNTSFGAKEFYSPALDCLDWSLTLPQSWPCSLQTWGDRLSTSFWRFLPSMIYCKLFSVGKVTLELQKSVHLSVCYKQGQRHLSLDWSLTLPQSWPCSLQTWGDRLSTSFWRFSPCMIYCKFDLDLNYDFQCIK